MGKKSKSPPAQDYAGAAEATAQGNLAALQWQTQANRNNTVTPFGSSTWTNDGNNNWTNTVTLTPEMQAALDQQQQITNKQSELAGTLQGQVADTMSKPFQAPQLNDYIGNGPNLNSNFSGFNGTGNNVNLNYGQFSPSGPGVNTNYSGFQSQIGNVNADFAKLYPTTAGPQANFSGFDGSGNPVNVNAPEFSDANAQAAAQAAYSANTELLQPRMEQDKAQLDNQLRLQGLQPGTEAYDNAMQNLTKSQAAQLNQIANQSVLTGNSIANENYRSQLAGYDAGLRGQGQDFSQQLAGYQTGQQALAANNNVSNQQLQQQLATAQFNQSQQMAGNAAQNQQYQQQMGIHQSNQDAITNANAAQNQNFQQQLAGFGANQGALNNYNAAQAQQYGQALGAYQTGQDAINNANQVQQQQYLNNLQNYQTAYTAAQNEYMQPLNALNAVLNGQQVAMPQFQTANTTAGYAPGADYLTAAQLLGQYQSGQAAQSAGQQNALMGGLFGLGSAFLGNYNFSDARLKSNVERVGTLPSGLAVYEYDIFGHRERGVMAQEAAIKFPEAVAVAPNGYLMVDYSRIR